MSNKPHKHAELIKQWADGAEIEREAGYKWIVTPYPSWYDHLIYRVKPQPLEYWVNVYPDGAVGTFHTTLSTAEAVNGGVGKVVHMREVCDE